MRNKKERGSRAKVGKLLSVLSIFPFILCNLSSAIAITDPISLGQSITQDNSGNFVLGDVSDCATGTDQGFKPSDERDIQLEFFENSEEAKKSFSTSATASGSAEFWSADVSYKSVIDKITNSSNQFVILTATDYRETKTLLNPTNTNKLGCGFGFISSLKKGGSLSIAIELSSVETAKLKNATGGIKGAYYQVFSGGVDSNSETYKLVKKSSLSFKSSSRGFENLGLTGLSFDEIVKVAIKAINGTIPVNDNAIVAWRGTRQTSGNVYQQGYWQNGQGVGYIKKNGDVCVFNSPDHYELFASIYTDLNNRQFLTGGAFPRFSENTGLCPIFFPTNTFVNLHWLNEGTPVTIHVFKSVQPHQLCHALPSHLDNSHRPTFNLGILPGSEPISVANKFESIEWLGVCP